MSELTNVKIGPYAGMILHLAECGQGIFVCGLN
jgi:hypothetical protein